MKSADHKVNNDPPVSKLTMKMSWLNIAHGI
jgi:hypothetical protein